MRLFILLILTALLLGCLGTAKEPLPPLDVPKEYLVMENPVPHTDASVAQGKKLYAVYCTVCHGEKGEGKGELEKSLGKRPGDLTRAIHERTEGELYYVTMKGFKKEMLPYENLLKPEEIWHLVNYMHTFG